MIGYLAGVLSAQGDHAEAVRLFREVVVSLRQDGSEWQLALALANLGVVDGDAGDVEGAVRSLEEAIALSRRSAFKPILAAALSNLGRQTKEASPAEALANFSESLRLARETEQSYRIGFCIQGGATILAARGNFASAATLLSAADAIRTRIGMPYDAAEQAEIDSVEAMCREALSPEEFARARNEGAALDERAAADDRGLNRPGQVSGHLGLVYCQHDRTVLSSRPV